MDIELVFAPDNGNVQLADVTVETRGGRTMVLDSDDAVYSVRGGRGTYALLGVYCPDDGGYRPGPSDMAGAKLVNASWTDDDGNAFRGGISILKAWAAHGTAGIIPLGGTPLDTPVPIDYQAVDRNVREMVRYFNACGCRTRASCGTGGLMRIMFRASVSKKALIDFPGGQPSKGRFCSLFLEDGLEAPAYVAASAADVSLDLAKFQARYPAPAGKEAC